MFVVQFLILTTYAQDKVTIGTPYTVVDAGRKLYYENGNEVIMIKLRGKETVIQKLDSKTLKQESINVYKNTQSGINLEKIVKVGNSLFLLSSGWDRENKIESLYSREIDFETGTFVSDLKTVFTTTNPLSGVWDKYEFHSPYDSSGILVTYRLKPEFKDDNINYDRIGVLVLNNDLSIQSDEVAKMPYTEKKMDNLDYCFDQRGNIYILARIHLDNSADLQKKKGEPANYRIELLVLENRSSEFTVVELPFDRKFVRIRLYDANESEIYCAGFYSTSTQGSVDGAILMKIDKSTFKTQQQTYEIPNLMMGYYEPKRVAKKIDKKTQNDVDLVLTNLYLDDIVIDKDGSVLIIGEEYYSKTYTTVNANGSVSTRTVYFYEDIYLIKINSDLSMRWMQKLPKSQTGSYAPGSMSYKYIRKGDTHNFIYFDNPKNTGLDKAIAPLPYVNGKGAFLFYYQVDDQTGELTKKSGFSMAKVKGIATYQYEVNRIFNGIGNSFNLEVYIKKKRDAMINCQF